MPKIGYGTCPGSPDSTSCIVYFYFFLNEGCNGIGKYGRPEKIIITCTDNLGLNTIRPHNFNSVYKRKSDSLKSGPTKMSLGMPVQIKVDDSCTDILIVKHALCPISKRNHTHTIGAYLNFRGQVVHFFI